MNYSAFLYTKRFWITIVVCTIVAASVGVGIWLIFREPSKSKVKDALLLKSTTSIFEYKIEEEDFNEVVMEPLYGITAFDFYPGKTIYYTTTKPSEAILSSVPENLPNIPQYTKDWTKTALAVDFISDKLYVLDSLAQSVYLIDTEGKYYTTVVKDLVNPKDILLDPYESLLFVLQSSMILQASMDGKASTVIVKDLKREITAFTIDRSTHILYYVTSESIRSFDYNSKIGEIIMSRENNIQSIAYLKNNLWFAEVMRSSGKPLFTETYLKSCHLTEGQCSESQTIYNFDLLQSLKPFENKPRSMTNPCGDNNGNCQHLCVMAVGPSYTCACNEGWKLNNDGKNCTNSAIY